MDTKRNFLDLEEVRTQIFDSKISKSFIYVMAKNGKFKTVRFGRKILVPASEAARLLVEGVE